MVRRILVIGLCAAALACSQQKGPKKSGPVVAKGNGIAITADEFKARLDEQSPFIRARYTSLERKKEFLDSLIRFEVLAREAEKQGLGNDPDVQNTLKKIMVQKLVQKNFQDQGSAASIPDPELQKYYDEHKDEYVRAKRVRVAAVVWNAPQGSPDRAKKLATAQKALAKLKAEEKKNTLAFAQIVAEYSEDAATKATAGDLQFKTREELEKAYSKELAEAAFKLKPGESSGIVQAPQGLYLLKYTGEQPELNRTFDQVKAQIANKLHREKKTKDFDEWLKGLRTQANVTVDDKALEAIEVQAQPAAGGPHGGPGMPTGGMPPGHGGGMMGGAPAQPGGAPAPTPAAAPAPAPTPAKSPRPVRALPLAVLALAALAASSGCSRCGASTKDAASAARAVATVNGETISADALARELRDARVGAEDGGGGADVLRRRVLDDLMDRALLLQEARARSVVVGQDQVERAFLRVRSEYPGTHFDDLLAQERLSQTELKARLKEQLTIERLFEQEVFPRVQVVDAEIERFYADHAADYQEAERVRVMQIVVATRDEAVQIRDRLRKNPQTFADVARKSSIGPEGKDGGDLGYIGRGSGFPEVFDACFTMPLNVISDVTPSPYGFHLFKVVDRKPAHKRPLEQARGEIAEKLMRERRAEAQEEFVRTLRQRAKIEVDENALASVTP